MKAKIVKSMKAGRNQNENQAAAHRGLPLSCRCQRAPYHGCRAFYARGTCSFCRAMPHAPRYAAISDSARLARQPPSAPLLRAAGHAAGARRPLQRAAQQRSTAARRACARCLACAGVPRTRLLASRQHRGAARDMASATTIAHRASIAKYLRAVIALSAALHATRALPASRSFAIASCLRAPPRRTPLTSRCA